MLTSLQPEEVQRLVLFRHEQLETGCKKESLSFDELAGKIQLTQLCEKTCFQYLVASRKTDNIRPLADDGWGTMTSLCREYPISRY